MKMSLQELVSDILLEMALDESIPSGIVELNNPEHIEILACNLFDRGASPALVAETVNRIAIRDGQFPDRQAYNKDGWLVTFPSPEYKQAAIKRGTHYNSDPTHGRGGMNLYYKKRGKQKRMAKQDASQTNTPEQEPQQHSSQTQDDPTQPSETPDQSAPTEQPPISNKEPVVGNGTLPPSDSASPQSSEQKPEPTSTSTSDVGQQPDATSNGGTLPPSSGTTKEPAPQEPVPQIPDKPEIDIPAITVEFALAKGWSKTPYGDWRGSDGTSVAVESLSGEVTPIKSVYREELKLFAEKKKNA